MSISHRKQSAGKSTSDKPVDLVEAASSFDSNTAEEIGRLKDNRRELANRLENDEDFRKQYMAEQRKKEIAAAIDSLNEADVAESEDVPEEAANMPDVGEYVHDISKLLGSIHIAKIGKVTINIYMGSK